MKTIEEIKLYFRISLAKELKNLDRERRTIVRKSLIWGIVLLSAFGIIFILLFIYVKIFFAPLIICLALYAYCWILIVDFLAKKYKDGFRNSIIMKLIEFVDNNLSYRPHGHIPEHLFRESAIFRMKHRRYEGKDLVCGMIDTTHIASSHLHATKKYLADADEYTIFNGLLFIIELNKPVAGKTVVIPKTEMQENPILSFPERMLENWNECDPVVKTGHYEFEKHFVIHGNSQKYTTTLLCPELLQAILDFKIKQQNHLYLSFMDSKMFVAIAGLDPFSPSLFSTPLDFQPIQSYFEFLSFCMNISTLINSATSSIIPDDSSKKQ